MGLLPRQVSQTLLALLILCGSLPFGLVVLGGAQWAPAAHIGMFLTGSMPLFTALMAWAVLGDRVTGVRLAGLLMILAGLLVFGTASLGQVEHIWRGDLMFLLAAVLWAVYTLAFGKNGLTPWQGAARASLSGRDGAAVDGPGQRSGAERAALEQLAGGHRLDDGRGGAGQWGGALSPGSAACIAPSKHGSCFQVAMVCSGKSFSAPILSSCLRVNALK